MEKPNQLPKDILALKEMHESEIQKLKKLRDFANYHLRIERLKGCKEAYEKLKKELQDEK